MTYELRQIGEVLWEIPASAREDMRVPARIFADGELLEAIKGDLSLEQLENVATLPGIVGAALAMPDIHQGYGFPVGGVAAMEVPDGVVSPGGVGYDINCGVRLLALPLSEEELGDRCEGLVAHLVREAIGRILGKEAADGTRQVYDVAHNVAKIEEHGGRRVCVHRKGATRAFPAGSPEIPEGYRGVGQPVFIPGSMGTSSFVLAGEPGSIERSFGTTCHGAGRRMSRHAAARQIHGGELRRQLEAAGIVVRCPSNRGLAEEAPFAYKDVERVVAVVEKAGLARRVAQLRPVGVVKG